LISSFIWLIPLAWVPSSVNTYISRETACWVSMMPGISIGWSLHGQWATMSNHYRLFLM
jgi:hypothetical protein